MYFLGFCCVLIAVLVLLIWMKTKLLSKKNEEFNEEFLIFFLVDFILIRGFHFSRGKEYGYKPVFLNWTMCYQSEWLFFTKSLFPYCSFLCKVSYDVLLHRSHLCDSFPVAGHQLSSWQSDTDGWAISRYNYVKVICYRSVLMILQ